MNTLSLNYNVEIDRVTRNEWSSLLLQFDDATIYQTWSYGSVRWGRHNLSHLVLKRGDEVVGLAQVAIKKMPVINAGIAYIPWGPLWQPKAAEKDTGILQNLIQALKDEYIMRRGLLLRIAPCVIENDSLDVATIFSSEGFQRNLSFSPYRTLLLDLTPSLEELRKGMAQKWRNQLNRAEKNGLKVIEGTEDRLYHIFLTLQKEMLDRKEYLPGVDYDEFREIQKDLPEPLKMRIIVCEFQGKPVSTSIGSAIGNTGIYLLGATGTEGLNLKGSYLLQWRMIQWLKDKGCRWYDLGGINPEKNPGVYHFKAGLSGKDVCHIGQFEICPSVLSRIVVKFGEFMRANLTLL